MAKRKRNQSSAPGTEPNVGKVEHKKQKTDINLAKEAQSVKPQDTEKSETGAAPTSKPQTADEASPPAVTQDEKPFSKSQRKRHRHMQKLREAKKASRSGENPELKDPSNDAAHAVADKKAPVSTGKPDQEQKRKADAKMVSSEKVSKPVTSDRSKAPRKNATDVVPNQKHPKPAAKSLKPPRKENEKPIVRPNQPKALDAEKPTAPPKAADGKLSKRQRRRQKLRDRKSGVSLDSPKVDQAHHVTDAEAPEDTTTTNISPEVTQKHGHSPEPSLMQKITKTTLLPRPEKQWIEQEEGSLQEGNVPDAEKDLHKELTRTTLLPRPTKQWVQEDEPMADETASDSSDVESPQKPVTDHVESPAVDRLDDKNASEKRSKTSSPSDSEQSSREERSFAKVGLPTSTETPPTRPGAKTIASFSFSPRRHPADILSNERRSSGLSALRTDAGSFGAYAKPMSSMKANSVPSYSSTGDVKAAFQRFNNFTHNRDEDDSEADSEDSDESDSDESDSDVEAEKAKVPSNGHPTTKGAISGQASQPSRVAANIGYTADEDSPVDGIEAIEETPKEEPANRINNAGESTDSTNEGTTTQEEPPQEAGDAGEHSAGSSSRSSDREDEDESEREGVVSEGKAQPHSNDNIQDQIVEDHGFTHQDTTTPQETPSVVIPTGIQAEAEASLPLFGDFNARQSDQTTDTEKKHSGSFLGLGHGGNSGGAGAANDSSSANNFPEEKDDLFQSIDEISRDVFGATRPLPDCKPPSNSLDLISEPLVTDDLSNTCLKKNLAKKDMSEKAKVLENIVRGASPVVWIVNTEESTGDIVLDNVRTVAEGSSPASSLSSLTESPTPPIDSLPTINVPTDRNDSEDEQLPIQENKEDNLAAVPARKKRKMTGTTSKHFSPQKSMPRTKEEESSATPLRGNDEDDKAHPPTDPSIEPLQVLDKPKRPSKKQTGTASTFFTPTPSPTKPTSPSKPPTQTPRPPKGTSTSPIPPTTSPTFGLIQETLWHQPFWLLIAVTFLNKTTGRAAVPIFWRLKTLYPTPEALSQAHQTDLVALITTLGLQNQRAKRLISIAKAWIENPPEKARRYRTLHYPARNDGKALKPYSVVELDPSEETSSNNDSCAGALEIGHIPGCGPYAWDSWRIFCRDVARGLAEDYNGKGRSEGEGFEPEWKRVLPLDKELRACLRWMWLREGWVWDAETGERREATGEERERGVRGEMVIGDEGEGKFARDAAVAAGVQGGGGKDLEVENEGGNGAEDDGVSSSPPPGKKRGKGSRRMSIARRELDVESESEEVDSPPAKRARRAGRAQRAKRG